MHSVGQKCPHDLLYLKACRCSVTRHRPGSQGGPQLSPTLYFPLLSEMRTVTGRGGTGSLSEGPQCPTGLERIGRGVRHPTAGQLCKLGGVCDPCVWGQWLKQAPRGSFLCLLNEAHF